MLPSGYAAFLSDLKERIRTAQVKAGLAFNWEIVLLYWRIGRGILARQEGEGWGAKVIGRLSRDLRAAFPDIKGFSPRSLKYMRAFVEAWPDEAFVQGPPAQMPRCQFSKMRRSEKEPKRKTVKLSARQHKSKHVAPGFIGSHLLL